MNPNVLTTIQTIAQIVAESNIAVGVVFALIKTVRENWPRKEGEPVLSDAELIAAMRSAFLANSDRNAQLIAEIEAGLPTEG